MSGFSGFDGEAVGFDSISQNKRQGISASTQTNYLETGTASQTNTSKECGISTTPEDLNAADDILKEYPPPGLTEFLRRVVPGMLEQLDQDDPELAYHSSDSDEDETIVARVFQELELRADTRSGSGDCQPAILGLTWSSAGNSLAVSIGHTQHEDWCQHDGLIRVYRTKRSDQDKFSHTLDVAEKSCVTVLKYHPSVGALLAYGTACGDVVLCNLQTAGVEDGFQLSSPAGCHGSKRVTALQWAEPNLANTYMVVHITRTGKRRGASNQILVSSGCDGTVNVWQVNANLRIFENVITYNVNGSRNLPPPDITCFDFIKVLPLRPNEDRVKDDIFAVGTKTGKILLCKTMTQDASKTSQELDPVYEELEGHATCVLDLAFSYQRPGVFCSISMDSELKVYDVRQSGPLRVLCLDVPVSCMSWLPSNPSVAVLGLSKADKQALKLYNVSSGKPVKVEGLTGSAGVCSLSVNQSGGCRVAAGDSEGVVRIYDLPSRRIRMNNEDLEF